MPPSKSNGLPVTTSRRRGRGRATTAESGTPAPGADWIERLDALALALAELPERSAIIERAVREVMALLPAESVVVVPGDTGVAPNGTSAAEDATPGRATIPLEVGGRHFGALELELKSDRPPEGAERTFLLAIARQCALALARLSAADGERQALRRLEASGVTFDPEAIGETLDRVTAGVRALVSVARSAALPPPERIAQAEKLAMDHLADLRKQISGR
jgi:hypothetical protein